MKSWTVQSSDGISHTIQYKKGFRNKLIVDGETYKLKSSNWCINLIDYSIDFEGAECRLVVMGNKADLAVNGTFLDSKQPYEPLSSIPSWIYVLVGISTIGGLVLFGLIGLCIGLIMSTLYMNLGLKKKKGAVIGSFIGCTLLQIALGIFTAGLLNLL